jgi:hypothetical protein
MVDNETQSEGIVKEKGDRQKAMSELGICKLTAACTVKYSTGTYLLPFTYSTTV